MRKILRAGLLAWVALLATAAASAEPEQAQSPAAAQSTPPPATLEIGGRPVVTFRETVSGYKPSERAQGARTRLLAAYQKDPHLILTARHIAEGSQVLADGVVMFLVRSKDVNVPAGETPKQAVTQAIEVLRQVIEERAERSDPAALLQGLGFAAVATLFAILLIRVIFFVDRNLAAVVSRRVAAHVRKVRVSGVAMFDQWHTVRLARHAVHVIAWLLSGVIVFAWLNAALESLPFTRPWGDRLVGVTVDALAVAGQASLDAIPGLIVVVIIFFLARLVVEAAEFFFDRIAEEDICMGWLDRHTAPPTRILVTLAVWIFAIAMAYPYLPGADSRAFQGLSVLIGVMVSLGASSIVGQAAAGLILMYSSAFRVGDYVRIQDTEGTVTDIGIFLTRVRTGLGDELVLPNNVVIGNVTRNYSHEGVEPGFVVTATVTIGYDTPWRQVEAMLKEATRRTPGVVQDPAPRVFQTKLSDFYPEYRLAARCSVADPAGRSEALSRLHANIQDVFNEHDVQIMSPHYLGDPESPKVVPKAQWFKAPARPEER